MGEAKRNLTKRKSYYICQKCGYQTAKWMGRCVDCGEWNSMIEELEPIKLSKCNISGKEVRHPVPIKEIELETSGRIVSAISEFDRILGGGIIKGSLFRYKYKLIN